MSEKPWLILNCEVSRKTFSYISTSTNWQPSKISTRVKCVLCLLYVNVKRLFIFVYGISWHWIYDQTIEPPGNSFSSLCNKQLQMENAAKPTAILFSLYILPYWTRYPFIQSNEWLDPWQMTITPKIEHSNIILIIHLSIVPALYFDEHNNINFLFCWKIFNDQRNVIVCQLIVYV